MKPDFSPSVVGIGICTVDYLFVLPHLPQFGSTMQASQFLRQSGGLVATALVALARLGVPTQFWGRIGDDDDGLFIRSELEQEGVDTSRLLSEPGTLSRVALVLVDQATGERSFAGRQPSCSALRVADLSREAITSAKVLFIDDVNEITLTASRWAREAGVRVVLDPSRSYKVMKKLLPLVDVPIVPEWFAREWMPGSPMEAVVDRLCYEGAKIAVVTLGEKGVVVSDEKGPAAFPALPVEVVDTTGAGDAFHGGFIYGLLQGWDLADTVRFASAVGALNCRHLGGRTGLPTLAEVEDFLDISNEKGGII